MRRRTKSALKSRPQDHDARDQRCLSDQPGRAKPNSLPEAPQPVAVIGSETDAKARRKTPTPVNSDRTGLELPADGTMALRRANQDGDARSSLFCAGPQTAVSKFLEAGLPLLEVSLSSDGADVLDGSEHGLSTLLRDGWAKNPTSDSWKSLYPSPLLAERLAKGDYGFLGNLTSPPSLMPDGMLAPGAESFMTRRLACASPENMSAHQQPPRHNPLGSIRLWLWDWSNCREIR